MHVADALACRRRYAASLIASDHKEPRFFGLAGGSVSDPRLFGGARDRFAACFFTGGLDATLLFSLTRSRLLARLFTRCLASRF